MWICASTNPGMISRFSFTFASRRTAVIRPPAHSTQPGKISRPNKSTTRPEIRFTLVVFMAPHIARSSRRCKARFFPSSVFRVFRVFRVFGG